MQAISGNLGFTGRCQFGVNKADMLSSKRALESIPSKTQQDIFINGLEEFQRRLELSTGDNTTLAVSVETDETFKGKVTKVNVFKINSEDKPAVLVCSRSLETADKSGKAFCDSDSLFRYAADGFFNKMAPKTLKSLRIAEDASQFETKTPFTCYA